MQNIKLTEDQLKAEKELIKFLYSEEKSFVLTGHAGTGKTTLIKHLLVSYQQQQKLFKVVDPSAAQRVWAFTATTNKAAEALAFATGELTTTIHSLLEIKVRNNFTTGESHSFRVKDAEIKQYLVIVIDECSYIDDRLLHLIQQATDSSCKLIFMGDPNQLTPVGSDEVPVFNQNYPTAHLQQVVRQTEDSPIQTVCSGLRKTIQQHHGFPQIGLSAHIQHLNKDEFDKQIAQEFSRKDWKQGDSKILAWRNKTVQAYNKAVFTLINQRSSFQIGDYFLNNHYVGGLKADAEYQIESVLPAERLSVKGHHIKPYGSKYHYFVANNVTDLEKAKQKACKEQDVASVKDIMETWADFRPAYACTVNKSQGSTYQKVFIDLDDLAKCKDALQLARLLYVAISRSSNQVIFTGDIK